MNFEGQILLHKLPPRFVFFFFNYAFEYRLKFSDTLNWKIKQMWAKLFWIRKSYRSL